MADTAKESGAKPQKEKQDHSSLNIYQKIAAITGEVGKIAKTGSSSGYGDKYTFIEYGMVAGRLRELFASYGVVVVPTMGDRHATDIVSAKGSKGVNVLIDFKYRVVNADKPDETFEVDWIGEASDYGDKATNKAATAALKYYLMRQFNISEKGDDPDAETIDRGAVGQQSQPSVAPQNADKPINDSQKKKIFASLSEKGFTGDEQKVIIHRWAKVDSTNDLTMELASDLIEKIARTEKEIIARLLHVSATPEQFKEMSEAIKAKLPELSRESVLAIVKGISLEDNPAKLTKEQAEGVIKTLKEMDKETLIKVGTSLGGLPEDEKTEPVQEAVQEESKTETAAEPKSDEEPF